MKRMLFNATHAEETRVGIVDGQKLIDIDIETAGREQRKSNIYKGIITRIEPSLEACFVNYGEDRHGFLPFKEVGRTVDEFQWDLNYLLKLWEAICEAAQPQYELQSREGNRVITKYVTESVGPKGEALKRANPAPFLIVEESNLVIRAIRDYFQPEIGEILVDTDEIYDQARQFMAHVMPDMVGRVKRYREETPLFSRFQIEHQIETAYSRTERL